MNQPASHRRSPLISFLIFALALVIGLVSFSLLQFNLRSYKIQLAQYLEKALQKPVKIGDASLGFHNGLALDFNTLQIGDEDSFRLDVPKFSILIEPLKLLHRELVINQLLFDAPQLKITLPMPLTESTLSLENLGIKTLQIRNGSLQILHKSTGNSIRIDDLNLVLHGLGQGRVSQLAITGSLQQTGQNCSFKTFLEVRRQQLGQPWRQGVLVGNLTLNNIRTPLLEETRFNPLPEQIDLNLQVKGVPADSVRLEAALKNSLTERTLLQLSADWQSQVASEILTNLKLGVFGLPMTGNLLLSWQEEPHLSGQIEAGNLDLKSIFPPGQPALDRLSGQIAHFRLILDGPLHATATNPSAPLQSATLQLADLTFPLGPTGLTKTGLQVEWQNQRLRLSNGHGLLAGMPISFSGTTNSLQQPPLKINFELTGAADLSLLQEKFPATSMARHPLRGQAPFNLNLEGSLTELATRFNLDLDAAELHMGRFFEKKAGTPCQVNLAGIFSNERLKLERAEIRLDQSRLQLAGEFSYPQQHLRGEMRLAPLWLGSLRPVSQLATDLKLIGLVDGKFNVNPDGWSASLNLKEGGAHLTRLIGDLNQTRGTFDFTPAGISFQNINTRLGESPLIVSGSLSDWQAPLLSLHVSGKELRAQDLVFTNPEMKLQNLEGQLLINAGGISFDPVDVTVENKTSVRVSGQLRGYHEPHTYLEIDAEDADILDVIRLFSGPPKISDPALTPRDASLEIKARVKQGRLGSLFFENAQGTIKDSHHILSIFPLTTSLGEGQASGRVEIDRLHNNLLKISGHAENCDADRVYAMLFEQKGIFRGTLSGDFYLEGEETGEQFWKSAQGGIHLRIKDGVMRGMKGFAQVFSLLNVAQLFKFNLPDMDKEGLPFSLLESSGRMADGILSFDDFHITSPAINISAVGQIDTRQQTIDCTLGIKPLRTVDIILSNVPLFGWVLTGKEEALVTALFTLKGPVNDPKVSAAPVSSVAHTALGIIARTLGLPFHMLQNTGKFLTTPAQTREEAPDPPDQEQLTP
jgi:hypothetical protein